MRHDSCPRCLNEHRQPARLSRTLVRHRAGGDGGRHDLLRLCGIRAARGEARDEPERLLRRTARRPRRDRREKLSRVHGSHVGGVAGRSVCRPGQREAPPERARLHFRQRGREARFRERRSRRCTRRGRGRNRGARARDFFRQSRTTRRSSMRRRARCGTSTPVRPPGFSTPAGRRATRKARRSRTARCSAWCCATTRISTRCRRATPSFMPRLSRTPPVFFRSRTWPRRRSTYFPSRRPSTKPSLRR